MLQFSTEYPILPITQFGYSNPPFVPNIPLLREGNEILVPVCSIVANDAGISANKSPGRMYCYNLLSSQGWRNEAFAEVVKDAVDIAILRARSHGGQPDIHDAVTQVLAFFTSNLILSIPELASAVSPKQVASSASNRQLYLEIKGQIEMMYAQENTGYRGQAMGHPAISNTMQNRNQVQNRAISHPGAAGLLQKTPVQVTSVPSRFQKAITVEQKQNTAQATALATDALLLEGDIENMDREQHSIVYFGKEHRIPTAPIRRQFEEAIELNEEIANLSAELETDQKDKNWLAGCSLDELITVAMVSCLQPVDKRPMVSVRHGIAATAIVCKENLDDLFLKLRAVSTFTEVARVLQHYPTEKPREMEATKAILAGVVQLDRVLTEILNDFLENVIAGETEKTAHSTSFIEDAEGIPSYLNQRFSTKYHAVYNEYQRVVLKELFQHTRIGNDPHDELVDICSYGSEVYVENIFRTYSITFVNATSQELGYRVTGEKQEITKARTPMMNRLVTAIEKANEARISVTNRLLITLDGARYGIYRSMSGNRGFEIKEL